jgi:hypothetical protein
LPTVIAASLKEISTVFEESWNAEARRSAYEVAAAACAAIFANTSFASPTNALADGPHRGKSNSCIRDFPPPTHYHRPIESN